MESDSYTLEWTQDVDASFTNNAAVLARYVVIEAEIDPIHAIEALMVSTEFIFESGYFIHSKLTALNFPASLVPTQKISLSLFFFRLLILRELRKHFAWLCHLKQNIIEDVQHREYSLPEKTIFQVVKWFNDMMGVAPLITWVHGTRPDMHRVVSHASRILFLVYHSHDSIEHAIHKAADPVWEIPHDGEFLELFVAVANDAKMCVVAVEWPDVNGTPDVIVRYKTMGGVGLVFSPKDKILMLLLLLFSDRGDLIRRKAAGTPSCIVHMASHIAHTMRTGARGPVHFY